MSTTIYTTEDFKKLDKTLWTHDLIKRWNRRYGHSKKIAVSPFAGTSLMSHQDAKRAKKQWKQDQKKPLEYVNHLTWNDVPQRSPYFFSHQVPNWFTRLAQEKGHQIKEDAVYIDKDFLRMAEQEIERLRKIQAFKEKTSVR